MTGNAETSETRIPFWCPSTCFTLFIVISLLTHIAEIFLNAVYTWFIQADVGNPVWTATILGFLLLPLVVTQLFSAILFLGRRDSDHKKNSVLVVALIHVLQLGFIWRHLSILNERNVLQRKKLLVDLLLLRLVFAFTSGLPLLSLQTFYIVTSNFYHGIQLAAMIMCLVSTSWALASFRRQNETCNIEKVVLTWPGIVFRLLWRIGEITARVVSLALFASSYTYWTFLVLALHWLTMLICIWASILGTVKRKDFGRGSHVMICVAIGYLYTFTYLNFSQTRSKCRYICYYVILLLETAVLVASWLLHTPAWRESIKSVSLLATVVSAFILCVAAMVIYYTCCHMELSRLPPGNHEVCVKDECINCKLSLCTKHSQVLQRPFNTEWTRQYQTAVEGGHYYRNVLQDSLLDSASELEERCHGNTSFNDREVELIMETGASESKIVDVHTDWQNNIEGHLETEQQQQVECLPHGATADATSTVKSSLDLYNNLDNLQSDKSYTSSSLLKDKAFRHTATLSNSLLQMDSEFWNRDGLSEAGGLGRYNLPVSCIGHGSDTKQALSSAEPKHNRLTKASEPNETVEVLYENICLHSADVSVEDNRESADYSPRGSTKTRVPNHPIRCTDLEVREQNCLDPRPRNTSKNRYNGADDNGCNMTPGENDRGADTKCASRKHVIPWCPDEASATESQKEIGEISGKAENKRPDPIDRSRVFINTSPVPISDSDFAVNDSSAPDPLTADDSPVNLNDSPVNLNDSPVNLNDSCFPDEISPIPVFATPDLTDDSCFDDTDTDENPEMII